MTDKLKPGYHYAIVNDCEAIFEKYKDLKYPYCHGKCCAEYKYLAPVPSYEEWQDIKSKLQLKETAYDFDTARLEKQNAQLKELLKECRPALVRFVAYDDSEENARILLMNKINEVLK